MHQQTPSGVDLCASVAASAAETRLLKALHCPSSCRGLLVAIHLCEVALEAYLSISALPRVEAWLDIARGLRCRLEALNEQGLSGLRTHFQDAQTDVYSRLSTPYPLTLEKGCHVRALAYLGILISDACSHDQPLKMAPIEGWRTLILNKGRATDWREFSTRVPIELSELNAELESVRTAGLSALLQGVVCALGRTLVDPHSLPPIPQTPAQAISPSSQTHEAHQAAEPACAEDLLDGEDDPNKSDHPALQPLGNDTDSWHSNPIGRHVKASNYSVHLQRFDLIGHLDRLHPEATRSHWLRLKERFLLGGDREKALIACAHISQRLSQPARVVIALRLDEKRSTRLDVNAGTTIWNYRAALHASEDPALEALEASNSTYEIALPLDADISDYLRRCQAIRPSAITLAELLDFDIRPTHIKAWLGQYRKYLRDNGPGVHLGYDARFANSLGDVYRHIDAGEAMAFMGGLDLDALPVGMAHYISIQPETVTLRERALFEFLNWRWPAGWMPNGVQGVPIFISQEDFRSGWATCQQRTIQARADLDAADDASSFVESFNRLAHLRLLAFITLTGHRGTLLSRLTWRSIYLHDTTVHINDKDVGEYQSDRCVPVHRRLDAVLNAWQGDLELMLSKAHQLGLKKGTSGPRALSFDSPDMPAFFVVRIRQVGAETVVERAALRSGMTAAEANTCFSRPLNIGRHFLISELIARRVSTWYVRVLSGHSRVHAEPFSDGMHIPPSFALEKLRQSLESLLDDLDLAPVAGGESQRPTRNPFPISGRLPDPHDMFSSPASRNIYRVLPPPFDNFTTLALRVVDEGRARLCRLSSLSPSAEFTAAQTLFGLWDQIDQAIVFDDLQSHIFAVGKVACAVWTRPSSQQVITLPLNDRSVIALAKLMNHGKAGDWKKSAEEVGRWIRSCVPSLLWPDSDFQSYLCLLSLSMRYRRFHYSPDSLTAASTVLPSATFSLRSILRIAGCAPDEPSTLPCLGKALRQGPTRKVTKGFGPLYDVANALRSVSRIQKPLGGEIQRSTEWQARLDKVDIRGDLRARALKELHECEIQLWQKQDRKEADETSTLAGHLPEILAALNLLTPGDDISEFIEQEWREWIDAAKSEVDKIGADTKSVKENHPRHFGLKRMVRIARKIKWAAPPGMFTENFERRRLDGMRNSAASVALLDSDHDQIQILLANHFADWPLLQQKSLLAAQLLKHHPLRSSEQAALDSTCIVPDSKMLMIKGGKFSHLKTLHAYRLIDCAPHVINLIERAQDGSIDISSEYLFLNDSGWDWSDSHQIDEALVSATVQVTGEAAARKHSFRGSAYLRILWPSWEQIASTVLDASSSPIALNQMLEEEWDRGFTKTALAARNAGHGVQLVGLVYYAPAWPQLIAAQARALLARLSPDSKLIESTLGSTGSIRNEKSAANASNKHFDIWSAVARRCVKHMNLPPLMPTTLRAVVAQRSDGTDNTAPPLIAHVHLLAGLIAGGDRDILANQLGIAKPASTKLESMLPDAARRAAITKRRHGTATKSQLKEDRKFMQSAEGQRLLTQLASQPREKLIQLLSDLAPYRRSPRDPIPSATQLIDRIRSHLSVLPSPLRLQVRFSKKYGRILSIEHLQACGPRIEVGTDNTRLGTQPQFQILPAPNSTHQDQDGSNRLAYQHTQSKLIGRLTVATRTFIEAILIATQIN